MVSGTSGDGNECGLGNQPCFENAKDEASYWKQIAEDYLQNLQDIRDEFDEFQEGSRELESELEAQLEQYEQRVTELTSTKCKFEEENFLLKEKLESKERESYTQITGLQDENIQIKAVRDEMAKYIRELEQCNDDLERTKRATITSLEEFDLRLNNAIERNAFLENELEEKERLIVTVQRLKDESRDLKGDLVISSQGRNSSLNESKLRLAETQTNAIDNISTDTNKQKMYSPKTMDTSESDKTKINISIGALNSTPLKNGGKPLTPTARISALNIVSDLLRKVSALELKLANCRTFVQDHPRNHVIPKSHGGVTPNSNQSTITNGTSINGTNNSNEISISESFQVTV